MFFNRIALRKAQTLWSFGLFECNRVNHGMYIFGSNNADSLSFVAVHCTILEKQNMLEINHIYCPNSETMKTCTSRITTNVINIDSHLPFK